MSRASKTDIALENITADEPEKYSGHDESSVHLQQLVAKASMALESTDNAKKRFDRIVNSVDKGHKRLSAMVERENLRKGLLKTKLKTS